MTTADALLAGPRGRRMLLAFAREAERNLRPEFDSDSFDYAVFLAAYHLESGREGARVMFGPGAREARQTVITPEEVARRLALVPLSEVTRVALRTALAHAVDTARYWQDPEGEDVLANSEPVRHGLRRVAQHITQSPYAQWWTTTPVTADQWSVGWSDDSTDSPEATTPKEAATECLRSWHDETLDEEIRAERERPADPLANFSALWWSTPPVRCSTRPLLDEVPAGVWFVEDSMGWKRAIARRLSIPADARVYEVDCAQAWAALCRQFSVEVTAQKRHDWYRTTGRAGRWVVPDWSRLAGLYDGVHLTVAGYLATAGTTIAVDSDTASVIAGWAPDETYWLTDTVNVGSETRIWVCDDSGHHPSWTEEPSH